MVYTWSGLVPRPAVAGMGLGMRLGGGWLILHSDMAICAGVNSLWLQKLQTQQVCFVVCHMAL